VLQGDRRSTERDPGGWPASRRGGGPHSRRAGRANGYFATLYDIVHFYNTRDVPGAGWAAPEVPETVNMDELGNLGLTKNEELALVAFMKTLTDRAIMPQPAR
jgi:hypothetical protein